VNDLNWDAIGFPAQATRVHAAPVPQWTFGYGRKRLSPLEPLWLRALRARGSLR
jgi:hypothetical protein